MNKLILEGNKLILEGKEYTLSNELIEKIKSEIKKQKEIPLFNRVENESYFFISSSGQVDVFQEHYNRSDCGHYVVGNYCHDKNLMEQRAWRETLNRLLWRYSVEHDEEIICYGLDCLYEISYNIIKHEFEVMWTNTRIDEGAVLFKKEETARNAIKEVIKPFLEEHPEFHYFRW